MKVLLMGLLASGVSSWAWSMVARANDEIDKVEAQVVVITDDEAGDDDIRCIVTTAGIGSGAGEFVLVAEEDDDGRSERRRKVILHKLLGGKDRGWLGVSIGNVPEALAAQLDIEGQGVIVQNVVEGSPADDAGLQAHDVILSINGETVEGKVGRTIDLIKSHKPGDELDIVVLRQGQEKTVSVMLGSRADLRGAFPKWKFEDGPHTDIEERIKTRGRMLRRGPEGHWHIKDLGEIDELKNLSENIRMFLPKSGSRSVQVFADGGKKKIQIKVKRDGTVINLSQEDDGEITVSRVDPEGEVIEKTVYENEDELREADEEAYELWEKAGKSVVIHLNLDGLGEGLGRLGERLEDLDFDFDFDTEEWKEQMQEWQEHMTEWRTQLEESLRGVQEARERAMEELQEAMEQWKNGEGFPDGFKFAPLPRMLRGLSELPRFRTFSHIGKPRHTFEVQADGTIEVRIRKGDSELVQRYEGEDNLAQRSPKLFEKYDKLMAAEDEE